jgi:hypothetical protein
MPIAARNRDEARNQSAFFKWLKFAHPSIRAVTFAIPNGGKRDIAEAAHLKAQGVTAGVLDVFMSVPNAHYHGLYIEFKANSNTLTKLQSEFASRIRTHGYAVSVCYTYMEAINAVNKYLDERLGDNNGKF